MQKGVTPVVILLVLAIVGILVVGGIYLGRQTSKGEMFQVHPTITQASRFPSTTPQPTTVIIPTATPTAISTVNWNIYRDVVLEVEFKYPPDIQKYEELKLPYAESELCYPDGCDLLIIPPEEKDKLIKCNLLKSGDSKEKYLRECWRETSGVSWSLKIQELAKASDVALTDFVATSIASRSECRLDIATKSLMTVDGKEAVKALCTGIGDSITYEVFVEKRDNAVLHVVNFNENHGETGDMLDQILSTFQFLD